MKQGGVAAQFVSLVPGVPNFFEVASTITLWCYSASCAVFIRNTFQCLSFKLLKLAGLKSEISSSECQMSLMYVKRCQNFNPRLYVLHISFPWSFYSLSVEEWQGKNKYNKINFYNNKKTFLGGKKPLQYYWCYNYSEKRYSFPSFSWTESKAVYNNRKSTILNKMNKNK